MYHVFLHQNTDVEFRQWHLSVTVISSYQREGFAFADSAVYRPLSRLFSFSFPFFFFSFFTKFLYGQLFYLEVFLTLIKFKQKQANKINIFEVFADICHFLSSRDICKKRVFCRAKPH